MAERAAHLVDHVLPGDVPVRQWVLSVPHRLRYRLAYNHRLCRTVLNVVVRALSHAAPVLDAVVEECFPAAAMTSPHAFFDAVGDDAKLQRHVQAMMDSCHRFIDFDAIDVVPTSQYVIRPCA